MRKSVSSEWESARRAELKRMETATPRQSHTAITPERTAGLCVCHLVFQSVKLIFQAFRAALNHATCGSRTAL